MTDRESAIKGIEQCMMSARDPERETQCHDCPYYNPECTVEECVEDLRRDALALLKNAINGR